MVTKEQVRSVIESGIEDTNFTYGLLDFLQEFNGKRFDKRVVDKLKAVYDRVYLEKTSYGGTYLKIGDYSFIVSHANVNVVVDVAFIEEKNFCYFGAAIARNEKREKSLKNDINLEAMANTINAINNNIAAFRDMTSCSGLFGESRYDVRELIEDFYVKRI